MNDYKLALDVNCLGVIRVTQAFKKLVKAAKGRIVTVTSVNGRLSTPAAGPYVVSKFGAAAYMDCIRFVIGVLDILIKFSVFSFVFKNDIQLLPISNFSSLMFGFRIVQEYK